MKHRSFCQGCWEQMHMPMAIRGPLSVPFKAAGIRVSQMHPNLCTVCESQFTKVKKSKQIRIETTIFFADLRGYTSLSEQYGSADLMPLLHAFYDTCSRAVWERDGIVNKFIGDAVLAIFNFPLERETHVGNAVQAALELQAECGKIKASGAFGEVCDHLDVGIGIHSGETSIGEVGSTYRDFTAIGPVVNLASRLQSTAEPGEVLISQSAYDSVREHYPNAGSRVCQVKGIDEPITAYTISTTEE